MMILRFLILFMGNDDFNNRMIPRRPQDTPPPPPKTKDARRLTPRSRLGDESIPRMQYNQAI